MDTKPIERACSAVGGKSRLAAILGVTPPTVHQWVTGDRPIPAERCPDIEKATAGEVTCEDLRPDLSAQWAYLRGTKHDKDGPERLRPSPLPSTWQGAASSGSETGASCLTGCGAPASIGEIAQAAATATGTEQEAA